MNQSTLSEKPFLCVSIVFMAEVIAIMLFWSFLPTHFQINENSDYIGSYKPVAVNILNGNGIVNDDGSLATSYPPGYSLILATLFGFSEISGISERIVIKGFILFCMGLSCVIIFLLADSVWGRSPALISSSLWIFCPFNLWLTKQPNSTIPFLVMLFCCLYFLYWILRYKIQSGKIFFLIGLMAGLTMLIRPIALLFGLVMAVIIWFVYDKLKWHLCIFLITMLLFGNITVLLPWIGWVYNKTGRIILLSENGTPSMRDGLTFVVIHKGYRNGAWVPQDVEMLMQDMNDKIDELQSYSDIFSMLKKKIYECPLTIGKLFLIKALRCWYATDSQRFETPIALIQFFYIIVIGWSGRIAWKQGGDARRLVIIILFITMYFWSVATLASLSILRYMLPSFGLMLVLTSALFHRWLSQIKDSRQTLIN